MFKTPYSAQGLCQSEIKWDGEVCPSERGTKVPFAAVRGMLCVNGRTRVCVHVVHV